MSRIESSVEFSGPAPRHDDVTAGLTPQPFPSAPPDFVVHAVIAVRRFLQRLADLVVPANVALFDRCTGTGITQLLGAAARHRVADLLEQGPLTAAEIAARTGS